jgi:hypothetical protein
MNFLQYLCGDNLEAIFHNVPNTPENKDAVRKFLRNQGVKGVWIRGRGPRAKGMSRWWQERNPEAKPTVAMGPEQHSIRLDRATHFGVYIRLRGVDFRVEAEYRKAMKNLIRSRLISKLPK